MVNAETQGKVYPSAPPYLVGREKVREFARAVLSEAPLHHDFEAAKAAGYSDIVAPPTFPIVLQTSLLPNLLGDPEAEIELDRIVHGEQRFSYTRPIVVGDKLTATMRIVAIRQESTELWAPFEERDRAPSAN